MGIGCIPDNEGGFFFVYILAPILGGALAALFFLYILEPLMKKKSQCCCGK
jgi:glycerol uptake facilitator protein